MNELESSSGKETPAGELGPEGERLREAFRAVIGEPTAACPLPGTIYDAACGALDPKESLRLVDHSVTCTSCAQAFRLAREVMAQVEPAATAPTPEFLAPRKLRAQPKARWAFAGAGLLAAAGVLVAVVAREASAPIYRTDSVAITAPMNPGPLSRETFLLRWSPLAKGTRYSVNVATPDLTVLFTRGGLTEASVLVPASALAKVPAGAQVVWRVTALLADGRRVESTAFITAVQ
jgi:hypothetical protein